MHITTLSRQLMKVVPGWPTLTSMEWKPRQVVNALLGAMAERLAIRRRPLQGVPHRQYPTTNPALYLYDPEW